MARPLLGILPVTGLVSVMLLGAASSALAAGPPACTVSGTDAADVFDAADYPADAVICGHGGDDRVVGLFPGTFRGGQGDDSMAFNRGVFFGGAGDDRVWLNGRGGTFFGRSGDDFVRLNRGTFRGNEGADRVHVNQGRFYGVAGPDRVGINLPAGIFIGGAGDDSVGTNAGTAIL